MTKRSPHCQSSGATRAARARHHGQAAQWATFMRRGSAATGIRGVLLVQARRQQRRAPTSRLVLQLPSMRQLRRQPASGCASLLATFLHAQGSRGSPWPRDLASHRTCPQAPPGPWWRAPGPRRSPAMAVRVAAAAGLHARGVAGPWAAKRSSPRLRGAPQRR